MITVKAKELPLKEVLQRYKGKKIFLYVEVPEADFHAVRSYSKQEYQKVFNITFNLFTPDIGYEQIGLEESNVLPKELKKFFEEEEFIVNTGHFSIMVLLTYGVRLNVYCDMRAVLNYLWYKENSFKTANFLTLLQWYADCNGVKISDYAFNDYSDSLIVMSKIFEHMCKSNIWSDSLQCYSDSSLLAAYSGYNTLSLDVDNDKRLQNIEKVRTELLNKQEKLREQYGYRVDKDIPVTYAPKTIARFLGLELKGLINWRVVLQESKENTDLINEVKKYRLLVKCLKYLCTPSKANQFLRPNGIYTGWLENTLNTLGDYCDIFSTNPKKSYYVSITSRTDTIMMMLLAKYKGFIVNDTDDYYRVLAADKYGKCVDDVTRDERGKAKKALFMLWGAFLRIRNSSTGCENSLLERQLDDISTYLEDEFTSWGEYFDGIDYSCYTEIVNFRYAVLSKMYQTLRKRKDNLIKLNCIGYSEFIFEVSNKLNPYDAMLEIAEMLNTEETGMRVLSQFSIGNDLKELQDNYQYYDERIGRHNYAIVYSEVLKKAELKGKVKFRNVVSEVKKDFNLN